MAESASTMLNAFIEFCREHLSILMIAGVVLVILIIIFAAVRAATKKDDDEDLDFDENDFSQDKPDEQMTEKKKVISKKKINQTIGSDSIESFLEEISGIPINNIEEIEIKIQGAELRFKYSKKDVAVQNKKSKDKTTQAEAAEVKAGLTDADADDDWIRYDKEEGTVTRKFGPANIDTSRSGRMFTEDELQEQIRD